MRSLNVFTNPLTESLMYPKRIRNFRKINYEERVLKRPYIGDQLDYEANNYWSYKRPIMLIAPTGSGKTRYSVDKIVKRAVKLREYVLILTNRNPLNTAYKQDISKAVGKDGIYTLEGLQSAYEFGYVYIVNYQGLDTFLKSHPHIKFSYVICDECHYFLQDATFSDCSGSVLDMIPRKFEFAIRIYISATIDDILPYITRAELYDCNVDYDGNVLWKHFYLAQTYTGKYPLPIVYKMDADYSKINLQFYEDIDQIIEYLKPQQSQIMAFCSTKKECKKIGESIGDSLVIDSDYLHENPEITKSLVEKEGFDEKCLATTSVFSNGNNISSKFVRSVIITLLDKTEIMQMAGRRRIDYFDPNDGFTLYLHIPSLSEIKQVIFRKQQQMNEINKCKRNEVYLMSVIKDGGEFAELIRNVFELDTKTMKYKLNYLCEDKFYTDIKYLEYLYALISELGNDAYCTEIASMFNKSFDESMLFNPMDDRKKQLLSFVSEYGFPLSKDEFDDFKVDFLNERIKLFGLSKSDNNGSNRKVPGVRSINNRLAELGINIQIKQDKDLFILHTPESEVSE